MNKFFNKYKIAIVSGWFGINKNFDNLIKKPTNYFDCYFYTNNPTTYQKAKNKNWITILTKEKLVDDIIFNTYVGKKYKMMPHKLNEIKLKYDIVIWTDNKNTNIKLNKLYKVLSKPKFKNKILLRQNWVCGGLNNDLNTEIECSMHQKRYLKQKKIILNYVNNKLNNGMKNITNRFFWCGFNIYWIKNRNVRKALEYWYSETTKTGIIQDQIIMHFVQQTFYDTFRLYKLKIVDKLY